MAWLSKRGHAVVGVELSELAGRAFFAEQGIEATASQRDSFLVLSGGGIDIWIGDFFELTTEHIGVVPAWYDRAAVVALEPRTPRLTPRRLPGCCRPVQRSSC